ncbi:bifunctional murein DD-endopeptidase/murein LD-carboxypeptidase [Candidatus Providencia siddallii]|uniref:Murein DD-endopeptidase MepS/Murein LD-carboxypeptidase n=1 Tax=Candidatus Providencia siddallii TaxID=1715285 RepID=A0ABM9NNQ6_9GAMM
MLINKKNKNFCLNIIILIIIALTLISCSNLKDLKKLKNTENFSKNYINNNIYNNSITQISQDDFEQLIQLINAKSKIMKQYNNWKNVIYKLGGTTKKGIDCSSFVQQTFFEQFGIQLPRTTSEQEFSGKSVKRKSLKIGDIVLFKINNTLKHVGIYIGDEKFIHASTSNGVIISKITNSYWNKKYYTGRRIINNI